ncbi:MAG: glycoside hydrolase family 43 protein [Nocardioidaceae bacterium]|nr:glycoside hydrolase family 43 protein [Nocardioidaceae bacterium]
MSAGEFVNPIGEGADPSIVKDGDRYLWCQSEGNVAVAIWASPRLTSLGRKHVVWRAPASGSCSKQVWAPELLKIDDRWYVYFAASDGDNSTHRAYVLASDTADPLGGYTLHGPLFTGDGADPSAENLWAIDMTVLEHDRARYAIWSGWQAADQDLQHLYLSPMRSPVELAGPRVRICASDDHLWERAEESPRSRGLNEAPQVLTQGGRVFCVYSCAASWLPTYKQGMLELTGPDPTQPGHWAKAPVPVFSSDDKTYGVGHGGFARSPDGNEWWHTFHAKVDRAGGWRRAIHLQPMRWRADGTPDLGCPVPPGEPLEVPSGTVRSPRMGPLSWDFAAGADALGDFDYYGHHQFFESRNDGLHLGVVPPAPVNDYRSGEKVVLRDGDYGDLRASVAFGFVSGDRGVGLLFRTTAAGVGFDAQRGYFAGIVPRRRCVVLGAMDGSRFVQFAEAPYDVDTDQLQTLLVEAVGDAINVSVDGSAGSISHHDASHPIGSVGLRVVNTHARFESLTVQPLP